MRIVFWILAVLSLAFLIGACGEKEPVKTLTKAQRDSVLSESDLPGAGVVGKAIEAADSAAARSDRLDDKTR
jgi:hypothetical protein